MATTKTREIQTLAHDILIDSYGTVYDTPDDAENIKRLIELGAVRRAEESIFAGDYVVVDGFEMYFDELGF